MAEADEADRDGSLMMFTDDNGDEFLIGGLLPEDEDIVPEYTLEAEFDLEDDEEAEAEEQADGTVTMTMTDDFAAPPKPKGLPPAVDLRKYCSRIDNQRNTNTCAPHACNGAVEMLSNMYAESEGMDTWAGKSDRKPYMDTSPLFIYYNAKKTHTRETGVTLWACIDAMIRKGACSEGKWSFAKSKVLQKPTAEAFTEAASHKLESFHKVPVNLKKMKEYLNNGHAIITGLMLPKKFHMRSACGKVDWGTDKNCKPGGGHGMLIVGYSDARNAFIYRNSWGPGAGDRGYFYVDYRYATSGAYNKLGQYALLKMKGFHRVPKPKSHEVNDLYTGGIALKVLHGDPKTFHFERNDIPNLDDNEHGEIKGLKNLRSGSVVDVKVWGHAAAGQTQGNAHGSVLGDGTLEIGDMLSSGGSRPQRLVSFGDWDAGSPQLHGSMQICGPGLLCKVHDRVVCKYTNGMWYSGAVKGIKSVTHCDIMPDDGLNASNASGWSNVSAPRVLKSSDDGHHKKWAWRCASPASIPHTWSTQPIGGFEVDGASGPCGLGLGEGGDPSVSWAELIVNAASDTECTLQAYMSTPSQYAFWVWFDDGAKYEWKSYETGPSWQLCPEKFNLTPGRHVLSIAIGDLGARMFHIEIAKGAAEFVCEDGPDIPAAGLAVKVTSVDHEDGSTGKFFNFDKGDVPHMSGDVAVIRGLTSSRTGIALDVKIWSGTAGGSTGNAHGRLLLGSADGQFEVGDVLEAEGLPPDPVLTVVDPDPAPAPGPAPDPDPAPAPVGPSGAEAARIETDLDIARVKRIEDFKRFHCAGDLTRLHGKMMLSSEDDVLYIGHSGEHGNVDTRDSWADFVVYAKQACTVKFEGWVKTPTSREDSFFVWFDDQEKQPWFPGVHEDWTRVRCRKGFELTEGRHIMHFGAREPGAMLRGIKLWDPDSSAGFLYYPHRTTENLDNYRTTWNDKLQLSPQMDFYSNIDESEITAYMWPDLTYLSKRDSGCEVGDRVVGQYAGNGRWYSGSVLRIHDANSCDITPDDGLNSSNRAGWSHVPANRVMKSSDDGSRKKWAWRCRNTGSIPSTFKVQRCTGFHVDGDEPADAADECGAWADFVVEAAVPIAAKLKVYVRTACDDACIVVWFDKGEKYTWNLGSHFTDWSYNFKWANCPQEFDLTAGRHVLSVGICHYDYVTVGGTRHRRAPDIAQISFTSSDVGFIDFAVDLRREARMIGSAEKSFQEFDSDGSGFITEEELAAVLTKLMPGDCSPEHVKSMFKSADANRDGKIDYKEFMNWLMKPIG